MIGFIATTRNYKQYGAIAELHTLQFAVTHTPEFSFLLGRVLATDFSLVVIPVSL
jgi:hypothetical protein